jgi:hypothetical protein
LQLAQISLAHKIWDNMECSRQDAKNAKFGVDFFLAAFAGLARDDPTFGCGSAALCSLWLNSSSRLPGGSGFQAPHGGEEP